MQFWGLIFALRNSCSGNEWSHVSRMQTSRHFALSSVHLFVFSLAHVFLFSFCVCVMGARSTHVYVQMWRCVMGQGVHVCMHRCGGQRATLRNQPSPIYLI